MVVSTLTSKQYRKIFRLNICICQINIFETCRLVPFIGKATLAQKEADDVFHRPLIIRLNYSNHNSAMFQSLLHI